MDDPLFLIFRLSALIFLITAAVFIMKWRRLLEAFEREKGGMNISL